MKKRIPTGKPGKTAKPGKPGKTAKPGNNIQKL